MKLSRYGFNVLVLVWLAPVLLFDIVGNTTSTGSDSDFYYYKSLVDCALLAMAAFFVFFVPTIKKTETVASNDESNPSETVIGLSTLVSVEHIYCVVLVLYALASWWTLHEINKSATGFASIGSLIWSLVSVGVAALSALQFYNLKKKAIAETIASVRSKMTEHESK